MPEVLFCTAFNSTFLAAFIFSFKSLSFRNPEISDSLTNFLFLIFASSISLVDLFQSDRAKYLSPTSFIFAS